MTGGKLTTYREMAADTVDAALVALGRSARCQTRRLQLRGAANFSDRAAPGTSASHYAGRFGSDIAWLNQLLAADPTLAEPLVAGLPYTRAEAIHAVRDEMARTLDDVLSRRTRARLLNLAATRASAVDVARLIAPELGWTPDETAGQIAALYASIDHEMASTFGTKQPPEHTAEQNTERATEQTT